MNRTKTIIFAIALALTAGNAFAQHQHTESPTPTPRVHDHHAMPTTSPSPGLVKVQTSPEIDTQDSAKETEGFTVVPISYGDMKMSSVTNVGDPMEREASGTSWDPDSSPMYAKMKMASGGGMWMFMGTAFLRYTTVGSKRDVSIAGKGRP